MTADYQLDILSPGCNVDPAASFKMENFPIELHMMQSYLLYIVQFMYDICLNPFVLVELRFTFHVGEELLTALSLHLICF